MSILTYRYRFTTHNFETSMTSQTFCWCARPINFKRPGDYAQIRKELVDMYPDDRDMTEGVLIHGELCGIRIFGIRVI